ncbi:MAG: cysteine--tRNA ligase [Candidatus Micrarchaeaceae archaeon]
MKIYNTFSKKEEEFKPLNGDKVGFYTCGPTVYFYAHVGNMRNYIISDVLERVLLKNNYKVKHVMNLTDVGHNIGDGDLGEDKIKDEAKKEHKTPEEIIKFYTSAFFQDTEKLNIKKPDIVSRASDNIKEILEFIKKLDEKGYLYETKTGIYFNTSKFKDYGKLSGSNFEKLNEQQLGGARVERPEGIKNITDFAVWRFAKPNEKDMVWDSEFGRGFPGWHIECSTIAYKYLGEQVDIHYGGHDHIQVHHTNEIAQSEALFEKQFVKYWVHLEFLTVEGKKMSKSLKNIYTITDIEKKKFMPLSFRFMVVSVHYRKMMNFTFDGLKHAEDALKSIYAFISKISFNNEKIGKPDTEFLKKIEDYKKMFFDFVNNDLDIPNGIIKMHEMINYSKKDLTKEETKVVINTLLEFDEILGLDFKKHLSTSISEKALDIIKERELSRKERDFVKSDILRKKLLDDYKIRVEDTKEGSIWYSV